MSKVRDILSVKGDPVHTISETSSVLEAVKRMNEFKIGALVVMGQGTAPSGMITERDVLRRIATVANDLADVAVGDVMTKRVIVCGPDDQIDKVRSIMKHHYIRQLPVVDDDGRLLGIVSLGDVNSFLISEEATEIKHLHDYIHGHVR
jgi:CBS domain-containing protein